ncbi:hypothetical protein ACFVZN_04010 [Streptomyces virginiae]|uniref:hypothetical protein n=1 Tax=Streptomyces virginiae TaxID=1961 RepID=UPI0036B712BD
MTVMINEVDVIAADQGAPQPPPAAGGRPVHPDPAAVDARVEHAVTLREARADRLRAY